MPRTRGWYRTTSADVLSKETKHPTPRQHPPNTPWDHFFFKPKSCVIFLGEGEVDVDMEGKEIIDKK